MTLRLIATGSVLALALSACSAKEATPPAVEQDAQQVKTEQAVVAAPKLTKEEIEAAWEKAATPGAKHKLLQPFVGKWKTTVKYWPQPEATPEVSSGVSTKKWILGGRYLHDEYRGKAMGKPFSGMGLLGFSNTEDSFVSLWVDTASTGFMTSYGKADQTGKIFTFTGSYLDPVTKVNKTTKETLQIVDNNKRVFEMFEQGPDGKEFKTMEITYTRQ